MEKASHKSKSRDEERLKFKAGIHLMLEQPNNLKPQSAIFEQYSGALILITIDLVTVKAILSDCNCISYVLYFITSDKPCTLKQRPVSNLLSVT